MDLKSIISRLEELDRRHVTVEQETQTRMNYLETENETLKAKIHEMEIANLKLKKDCGHLKLAIQNIGELADNMNESSEHLSPKSCITEETKIAQTEDFDIVNNLSDVMDMPKNGTGAGDGVKDQKSIQLSEVFLPFNCHICDSKRFLNLVDLQEHQIHDHPDYGFICSHAWCPEIFKHKGHLLQHERMHCSPNDNDLEECPIQNCSVVFNRRWTSYHTKLFHSEKNTKS